MSVETPTEPAPPAAPQPARGPRISGPVAIGVDARRFFNLTRTLAVTEFKLRFFGSALGYLWQLMRPLLLFGVLYVVFTHVLKFNSDSAYYPVALLSGIVIFTFLSEATSTAVTSLVDREPLVRKVQFPRLVIPLSVVMTALMNLGLNTIVVVVFLLLNGGSVHWGWLEIPFLLALLALFAAGISTLLSALYVRYRDIRPVWEVLLQMMFYGTPIFYTIDVIGNKTIERLMLLNPLAAVIQQFRHAVIDPSHPSLHSAMGGNWALTAVPFVILIVLVVVAYRYFDKEAPLIAEDL
ncbi:ABC transporter permease [Conexibacter sp. JD483]|uniref:ABC transporter permease n=1 Tax=unclassified Conexibacter TaxID=2627773 RepID=UPI002715A6A9|nr:MULTISPECIES: ABC transporter permease [unclassified Conexibacter]MDO8184079.1 ABC transporter permease [Conexibacter sp. CPCC 205706]MDO8197071.1 ABC transporter permease [Conexibacter sp. CPCC 205762]MDR9371110.1 ABC transporter permease [Conexibacter sp. JD483]